MSFDLVQWQKLDGNGICYPWFTHPFLDQLDKWDLRGKFVWEWGSGKSTKWWVSRGCVVYSVETDLGWMEHTMSLMTSKEAPFVHLIHRPVNEGDQSKVEYYTEILDECKPDIVVIDGVLRHECLIKALALQRPLIIIHDNWMQDGFVCPASEELMAPYEIHNFIQEDHTDNHGRKWATAYWELK